MSDSYSYRSPSNTGFDIERALNRSEDIQGVRKTKGLAKLILWHLLKTTNNPKDMFQEDTEEAKKLGDRINRQRWYTGIPSMILAFGITTRFDQAFPTKQEGWWKLRRFSKLVLVYNLSNSLVLPIVEAVVSSNELAQDSKNMLIKHRHNIAPTDFMRFFSDQVLAQLRD